MQLTILASGTGWHVQDLLRAANGRSIEVSVSSYESLAAFEPGTWVTPTWRAGDASPRLRDQVGGAMPQPGPRGPGSPWVGSAHPTKPNAILVRMMPPGTLEQVIFRMDVLNAAQARGIVVMNPPKALETCIDKFLTTHRLAMAGLSVPRTWVGQNSKDAMATFELLGDDVVLKPLFGSEGHGVERITDLTTAKNRFDAIERAGGVLYLQEFIPHAGWDLRVFVIDGRVIAAMKRHAADGWRSNIALGGRAERVTLTQEEEKLAIDAARDVGCPIAGVDLLPGKDRMFVIEVNAVPGWKALSAVSGVDVAAAVIEYVIQQAS